MSGTPAVERQTITPQEIVDRALTLSRTDGCTVLLEEITRTNLRWANNEVTTNGLVCDRLLTVIALAGTASGTAAGVLTRSGPTLETLEHLVRAAEIAARSASLSEDVEAPIGWARPARDWHEPPLETGFHVFSKFATDLRDAFHRARAGGWRLFGYAQHTARTLFMASTTGARLRFDRRSGYLEITGRHTHPDRSAWTAEPTVDFRDIDTGALSRLLERRLTSPLRERSLPPGRYEVVLPATAVADLVVPMYFAAGAQDAQDGRTIFSAAAGGTRVGERIWREDLTLRSDPAWPGLECLPFVMTRSSHSAASVLDNGLPLAGTEWISQGRLAALVQTRRSAALTGLAFTPYVDNLILSAASPDRTADDLVAGTRRGLLVTSLWYIREVDARSLLLTGLTRDGVYLIEDGEVVARVNNFRFNESPVDVLLRVGAASATVRTMAREWRDGGPQVAMPALRIADFNMSTVSPAS